MKEVKKKKKVESHVSIDTKLKVDLSFTEKKMSVFWKLWRIPACF